MVQRTYCNTKDKGVQLSSRWGEKSEKSEEERQERQEKP